MYDALFDSCNITGRFDPITCSTDTRRDLQTLGHTVRERHWGSARLLPLSSSSLPHLSQKATDSPAESVKLLLELGVVRRGFSSTQSGLTSQPIPPIPPHQCGATPIISSSHSRQEMLSPQQHWVLLSIYSVVWMPEMEPRGPDHAKFYLEPHP